MPETLSPQAERYERELQTAEHQELLPAHAETAYVETAQERQERLTAARQEAQAEAQRQNPIERINAAEAAATAPVSQQINRELKDITLRRELQMIRRKLPAPQRALSRVVHQPVVRAISEVAGKTVTRPSGLLGGGLVAFIGTAGYSYLSRHIGFTYNYGVFITLFVGGFALGLLLELSVHLFARRKAD